MKLKRLLSLLLAAAMMLSVLPQGAIPGHAVTDTYNRILNGDFAQGEDHWDRNGNAPASSNVLKIVDGELKFTPTTLSGDAKFSQQMTLEAGTYVMSFDSKGQPGSYRPVFYLSKTNAWSPVGGTQHRLSERITQADAWTKVTQSVTVTEAGIYHFVLCVAGNSASINPTGNLYFDNFEVRKVLNVTAELSNATLSSNISTVQQGKSYENTVIPSAGFQVSKVTVTMGGAEVAGAYNAATGKISVPVVSGDLSVKVEAGLVPQEDGNLILNGDFALGEAGWEKNEYVSTSMQVVSGELKYTPATHGGDARFSQQMTLEAGTYVMSFDSKGQPGSYRPVFFLSKGNTWTPVGGQHRVFEWVSQPESWTRVSKAVTVTEAGTYYFVLCVAGNSASINPAVNMYFDNFAVRRQWSVSTDLSNATLSSDITAVEQGKSYENTVSPATGFQVSKVTVTMGGVEVAGAYNAASGKITIPAVTGDLHVKVETTVAPVANGNLLLNGDLALGEASWEKNEHAATSVQVVNGELKYTPATHGGDARFSQQMTLEAGTYVMSFDSKGQPGSYRPVFFLSKGNTWTPVGGQHRVTEWVSQPDNWTRVSQTVTVTEAGTYYFVLCVAGNSASINPTVNMYFDNFAVRKGFNVSVINSEGGAATGLAPYTLPHAANGAPFELVLTPESTNYTMTVSCTMGGVTVPVTKNPDGSVTIRIQEVTGDIVITADSRKNSYTITTGAGIANSNSAATVQHGEAYNATITSSNPNMKLYTVTYTMGGVPVNVPVVDGAAVINIGAVTGDVSITAVLVNKNIVAQWIFDVTKTLTGNGDWGDVSQTISIAHNGYYDTKNEANNQPNGTAKVKPNLLTITTNLPSGAAGWADASTVIGYKLPENLELGETYIMSLPIYAGNDHTTLASSRNGSTRSGVELVFTTVKPSNMWNANDKTVTDIYAEGKGVMAAVVPSLGKLSMDSGNMFHISFTVTEEIKAYAVSGNYLALIVNHQHTDGHYNIGNASLLKITEPATITTNIGDSVCDGTTITQKGGSYVAHIVPKAGYKVVSASYTMGGGAPVALTVVNGAVTLEIGEVTGNIVITAVTEELEPNNLLTNGSFILGDQFWEFNDEHFTIQPTGGSDEVNDPAFIQATGKPDGFLTQSFKVEKQTNYELTFRYKGTVPQNLALWAITSQRSLAWDSVVYKASAENASDWTDVTVVFNSGNYKNLYLLFRTVEGAQYGLDNIWIRETTKEATINRYQRPTLGTRPSDSPYDDYPYICDDADNLMPGLGFEGNSHVLEGEFSKVEADANAWEGNNSLHYSTTVSGDEAANLLTAGDFLGWDPEQKTIPGWEFNNPGKLDKLEFVELGGRRAIKLLECTGSENFNLEMMQKVYLEAGATYAFSFDFFGLADWGPNLVIYRENKSQVTVKNATTTGTIGEWTTLSLSFTPDESGYYYFSVRIHNGTSPQKAQHISNCSVTLINKGGDIRVDYELKELEAHTKYWLTLFVKAPATGFSYERFVTFGLTDPETGDFILMANPDAEGARPYKVDQQLVPMAYDGKWHIITVPFNTGDATWLNFTIYGDNCEAWFDNIYIFKEEDAKHFVSPVTDKDEAVVTDKAPELLGCDTGKNLFENHDLSGGNAFWGESSHRFGVFGNGLKVENSGSSIYGNALHYAGSKNPANTYYIKWIDVQPNTEYTFSAKYAITRKGEGFVGLINGYRLDSEVTQNRLFPTVIAKFGFGPEEYLESHEWQTVAVSFNTGERNRIGFVVCDAGGEAYIDELRLFKTTDGVMLQEVADNFPKDIESVNKTVTVQNGVVTGIPAGTTLENVLKNFKNSQFIRVFDAQGNEIADKNAKIGTGSVIQLMDGPVIKDGAQVIVLGDVNGDAAVDARDSAVILKHISGSEALAGVYLKAADTDGDGKITVSDAALNTKAPAGGKFILSAVGPNTFAQREEIEIHLLAGSDGLKAISGKLSSTDGLTFVKAEGALDGWELSVTREEDGVRFALGSVGGKATKTGDAVITLTYRVGMISTYDEAKLFAKELCGSTGKDLLTADNLTWMRKAPSTGGSGGNNETVPEEPIIVAARNRLKELSLAEVTISPAFDPEIKEYTATVPFEIDKVTVTAVAQDEDAVVTIGDTNLEYVGRNTVAVRVVSADGLQRTYKIVITREPPVEDPTEEPTQPGATEPTPKPNPQKPDSVGLILWITVGVLAAGAMTTLIIILIKRKKQAK